MTEMENRGSHPLMNDMLGLSAHTQMHPPRRHTSRNQATCRPGFPHFSAASFLPCSVSGGKSRPLTRRQQFSLLDFLFWMRKAADVEDDQFEDELEKIDFERDPTAPFQYLSLQAQRALYAFMMFAVAMCVCVWYIKQGGVCLSVVAQAAPMLVRSCLLTFAFVKCRIVSRNKHCARVCAHRSFVFLSRIRRRQQACCDREYANADVCVSLFPPHEESRCDIKLASTEQVV